ncbi:sensor histidine kinase [Schlesneria paludicola]|uniref:sensor histidine kinase n=1 Tax=Schlesneria paludicola TaxID=360056 RepID=UPI00029AB176|nr:HAMP domain-containing sensor histidine kinase [Schlesneria paludicola]
MRLADFILSNVEPILVGWENFAQTIGAGEHLDKLALRDHAEQILLATARDMKSPQTVIERAKKSKGLEHSNEAAALDGASDAHAVDRLGLGFDMLEVMSEYRALRASVLQLWHDSAPDADERDVDDLTRFNESIDQSLSKAVASYTKRVDQARDMFLAILSHDLRNPLGAIAMSANVLPMMSHDQAGIVECGLRIARSASVMERMISDLLDYTRTRLGAGMPVNPAPMDLSDLGRELIGEYRNANPDRSIEFRTDGNLKGRWDSDRIRQAMSNLMGNAIQHGSPEFPVTLSLRGEASNVIIKVHNGGEPIPPGELPKIFDPLIRGSSADHAKKNRPGSIGMGLYIAREVAKSHNGRIDVTSTVADGTSFTIRLPREASPRIGQPILDAKHIDEM